MSCQGHGKWTVRPNKRQHIRRSITWNCYGCNQYFFSLRYFLSSFVCVCMLLSLHRMREVDLGSGRALLIKEHGEFSAIGHKCPHYGAPLVKGESGSALCLLFDGILVWYLFAVLCSKQALRLIGGIHIFVCCRCLVQRARALPLARSLFQHRYRRH